MVGRAVPGGTRGSGWFGFGAAPCFCHDAAVPQLQLEGPPFSFFGDMRLEIRCLLNHAPQSLQNRGAMVPDQAKLEVGMRRAIVENNGNRVSYAQVLRHDIRL